MGIDSYQGVAECQWDGYVPIVLEKLSVVPDEMLHRGPTFEVETKDGRMLHCETCYFKFVFGGSTYEERVPVKENEEGIAHYVIAKDDSGEVVGIRSTMLSYLGWRRGMEARSKIMVKYRGQGSATPVEKAFIQAMQWFSDTVGENIVWKVVNENLETLESAKERGDLDPEILRALEVEQARWQALYGVGGKFGIDEKVKRIFRPTPDVI